MKLAIKISVMVAVLSFGTAQASWWGGNDNYYDGYSNYNDWPVWTPMYWAEEMSGNGWGDDWGGGPGYGGGPFNGSGFSMPWNNNGSGFSMPWNNNSGYGGGPWNWGTGNWGGGTPYYGGQQGYGTPNGGQGYYGAPYGGGAYPPSYY